MATYATRAELKKLESEVAKIGLALVAVSDKQTTDIVGLQIVTRQLVRTVWWIFLIVLAVATRKEIFSLISGYLQFIFDNFSKSSPGEKLNLGLIIPGSLVGGWLLNFVKSKLQKKEPPENEKKIED